MDLAIAGRKALVMGASQGLGFAIAKALHEESVDLAISSRNQQKLNQAAASLGGCTAFSGDYTVPGSATEVVEKTIKALGTLDILVVNTGGPPAGLFKNISDEQWQSGLQNLWMSTVDAIRAALPAMTAKHWGRIIVVTSVAAREPMPNLVISNGLRSGLLGLLKSVANEVAKDGITVNAVLPGYTMTERLKHLGVSEQSLAGNIPMGRVGQPSELAALTAFLASEKASYITGQAVACDGGYLRGY